ncbi:2,3-oxidosqualene cyclase [Streptomyces rectiverticillatus]|uniref:prenyltransferase/squalene oxidase repeat-containing protein n=1 Tax=Streptomyces rectiverticillatus TaxID=173860 RepID=UPI0015C2FA2E|nr:prenyltransferase/squalene oxidase repeat-containing protein [Streptomyces rectiverticillatus]QLE70259.1 2,3-oxidosqualene cyclase [Streptomyces rectiverticillatus]
MAMPDTATGGPEAFAPVPGAHRTYDAACGRLLGLQDERGAWEGEMEWSTMILSQYVIVLHVLQRPPDERARKAILQGFRATRTAEGGWGMHPQGPPSPYATTLAYVALRLLGTEPHEPLAAGARQWLHAQPGGCRSVPQWGLFWLALLGLVPYRQVAPVPPEAMLLPAWAPLHPERLLGWTRMLYQGMAYLYGAKFRADPCPVVRDLRRELFAGQGAGARVPPGRSTDVYVAGGPALRVLQGCLRGWERVHSRRLRRAALERCHRAVVEEQHASPHHGLSSVNALVECLVLFARDRHHPLLDDAVARLHYWCWQDGKRGLRICGDRSVVWDTSFAVEALLSGGAAGADHGPDRRLGSAIDRAHAFLRKAQITTYSGRVPPLRTVRHGWAFSDGDSRWPVSDCTAEAVGALLQAQEVTGPGGHRVPVSARLGRPALHGALNVVLDRQNPDGGFGTLDRRRAGTWLEALNPTEMFAGCMTDTSSVECTGSVLTALSRMRPLLEPVARRRAGQAMARGIDYIRACQHPDGSFSGTWGINYTYAAFHAARGLRAAGVPADDPAPVALARWLEGSQLKDGSWGEDWRSCLERRYLALDTGLPEMTAWAVLAGLDTLGPRHPVVENGIRWLCAHQQADGSWTGGHVNGVFFGTMMLVYHLYPVYFPALAVGRYLRAVALSAPSTTAEPVASEGPAGPDGPAGAP